MIGLAFQAMFEIFQGEVVVALLKIDNGSFLEADMGHIGLATCCQGLNGIFVVMELFLADSFADVGETFVGVEGYGLGEIFQGVEVILFFEVKFASID